ncbi:MAG: amine dehydrogenase large subunit [Woeseiaceae bacterium]
MRIMRVITRTLLCLAFTIPMANAQIQPQTIQPNETMSDPGANWFVAHAGNAGYVIDATTGEMHGLISIANQSPGFRASMARKEFYSPSVFWSRGTYGERTDRLVVHDFENLSPIAEIEIPPKSTLLGYRAYTGMMSDGRHLGINNLTPAQSISIVDVQDREFVGEVSTPGCSLVLPVENNDFLTICGDGTLMLIGLDENGQETNRVRSDKFFELTEDPIYDRPQRTDNGWFLFTNGGDGFNVTTSGGTITISSAFNIVSEEDAAEGWWPGGGELASVHRDLGLLYVTMHQGEQYSHHEPGTEVWVFNMATGLRIARVEFEVPVDHLLVTQEDEPLLIIGDVEGGTHVYDALKFTHQRTIELPGAGMYVDL